MRRESDFRVIRRSLDLSAREFGTLIRKSREQILAIESGRCDVDPVTMVCYLAIEEWLVSERNEIVPEKLSEAIRGMLNRLYGKERVYASPEPSTVS